MISFMDIRTDQNTHNDSNYTRHVLGDWSAQKGNAIKLDNKLEWLEIN